MIEYLVKNGAQIDPIDHIDNFGKTPLMYAVENSTAFVELLVNCGANLDLQDSNGSTPLILAVHHLKNNNSMGTVKLLIESGANLDLKDNKGYTALIYALCYVDLDFVANHLDHYKRFSDKVQLFVETNNVPPKIYDFLLKNQIVKNTLRLKN